MLNFREVLSRWESGELSMLEAAEVLGVSERGYLSVPRVGSAQRTPAKARAIARPPAILIHFLPEGASRFSIELRFIDRTNRPAEKAGMNAPADCYAITAVCCVRRIDFGPHELLRHLRVSTR